MITAADVSWSESQPLPPTPRTLALRPPLTGLIKHPPAPLPASEVGRGHEKHNGGYVRGIWDRCALPWCLSSLHFPADSHTPFISSVCNNLGHFGLIVALRSCWGAKTRRLVFFFFPIHFRFSCLLLLSFYLVLFTYSSFFFSFPFWFSFLQV